MESEMAKYLLNQRAVDRARELIDAKQYVLDSDWGDVQPDAGRRTPISSRTVGTTTRPGISG
jgi:hypothetical protein